MKHIRIFSTFCIAVFFASCTQNSVTSVNDGSGNSVFWIIPEIGTEEIYQAVVPDSVVTVSNTLIILATKQHVGGKTNVIRYSEGDLARIQGSIT